MISEKIPGTGKMMGLERLKGPAPSNVGGAEFICANEYTFVNTFLVKRLPNMCGLLWRFHCTRHRPVETISFLCAKSNRLEIYLLHELLSFIA